MRLKLFVLATLAIGGCATPVPPAKVVTAEHLRPIESSPGESKTIFIANISAKLVDRKIGQMKGGTLCLGEQDLVWQDSQSVLNAMKEQIASTLSQHGYNVYSGLIQSRGEKDADVLIGVGIENIKANMCYSVDGMKGEASLSLKWEILDSKRNDSFSVTTSGSSKVASFSRTGDPDVFVRSVEIATENLIAQRAFFQATRK